MGCRDVKALDINANANVSRWQIAKGLVKPLAGIIETVKAGNKVIFDQDENGENISRIVNKATQVVIPIEQEKGQYAEGLCGLHHAAMLEHSAHQHSPHEK